jgi:hypothetical protein
LRSAPLLRAIEFYQRVLGAHQRKLRCGVKRGILEFLFIARLLGATTCCRTERLQGASEISHDRSPLFTLDQLGVLVADLGNLVWRAAPGVEISDDHGCAAVAAASV